ncbi:protein longifolia 1 [Tanacetum coccineum]|uniref:Protein longifolia 1 n=1 Tax=Tanacetum coccineum TaxID=301880 RepID=A0ABQ4WDP7_9ASTR
MVAFSIDTTGTSGGIAHRIKAKFRPLKNGCYLISPAPFCDPNRFSGSFTNNPLIRSRAWKLTCGVSGNSRLCRTTLANVSSLPEPLKGEQDTRGFQQMSWIRLLFVQPQAVEMARLMQKGSLHLEPAHGPDILREDESHDGIYMEDSPWPVKHMQKTLKDDSIQVIKEQCEMPDDVIPNTLSFGVSSEINHKKLRNIEHLVQKLTRLNSTHDEAHTDYIASLCENTKPDDSSCKEVSFSDKQHMKKKKEDASLHEEDDGLKTILWEEVLNRAESRTDYDGTKSIRFSWLREKLIIGHCLVLSRLVVRARYISGGTDIVKKQIAYCLLFSLIISLISNALSASPDTISILSHNASFSRDGSIRIQIDFSALR